MNSLWLRAGGAYNLVDRDGGWIATVGNNTRVYGEATAGNDPQTAARDSAGTNGAAAAARE